jgi:FkbM family methyltransferase
MLQQTSVPSLSLAGPRLSRAFSSPRKRDRAAACFTTVGLGWILLTTLSYLSSIALRMVWHSRLSWVAEEITPSRWARRSPDATKAPSGLDWYFANADPRVPFDYETRRLNPAARTGCSNSRIWIDVGANHAAKVALPWTQGGGPASNFGQTLTLPWDLLGSTSTFAFEPQLQYFHALKDQGGCTFPFNAAAGSPAGPATFSVSLNGHSSSLLPPAEGGALEELGSINLGGGVKADYRKEVSTVRKTSVMMVPLDDVIPRLPSCRVEFLKVDAQGYDLAVCKSAGEWIKVVDFIEIETPGEGHKCLYEGCAERDDVLTYFKEMGFVLLGDEQSCCGLDKIESNLHYVNTAHKDVAIGSQCPGEGCKLEPLASCTRR